MNENLQNQLESEGDLTEGLIGESDYSFEIPKKKDFLPWHKPRKQFVRDKQWVAQMRKLISENAGSTDIIKYLGLPGDDFLDLRYFHEKICKPQNIKLRFLGFNKGIKATNRPQVEVSLDEVQKLSHVDIRSEVIPDDITSIAVGNSLAWQRSRSLGPFDVINIDLCDGFARQSVNGFEATHYNTLNRLMTLQSRRVEPWLLLLTTRTDAEGVNENVFSNLKELYISNLNTCSEFSVASKTCFNLTDSNDIDNYCSNPDGFTNVFLTALNKWILKIGLAQVPQTKIEIKSVLGYKVAKESSSIDLISIAVKIIPTLNVSSDPIGLVTNAAVPLNECSLASNIVRGVNRLRNVDDILSSNDEAMREVLDESKLLLEQARYDIQAFDDWLRDNG